VPDLRPTPLDVGRKTVARVRARGPAELAGLLRARLAENLWSNEQLVVFVRALSESEPPPAVGELTFSFAGAADGPSYERDIGTDSRATFAKRLATGTRCFLARRGECIVHASWVTTRAAWTRELRAYFMPPPGDAYIYESYTRPQERGRGVYARALEALAAELGRAGIRRAWIAAEAHNQASLRAITRAGYAEAFRLRYRRTLGLFQLEDDPTRERWRFVTPLAP
jgi:ribosomal protein S18 acetylase RimI-like enzyme